MQKVKIKKGHDINISGLASRLFSTASNPKFVSISPQDFNYVKPKMIVRENDKVSMGDASPIETLSFSLTIIFGLT